MERLKVAVEDEYNPVEASIHVARYALALPFAPGRRVLDIACGEGYGSWLLAKAGATEVHGVDVSAEAVARARVSFRDPRIAFGTGQGELLAEIFAEDSFDLVVSIETIEHVGDPLRFLQAIRRVAKKEAVILLTCPNDHWYYPPHESNPYHRRKFTNAEFQALTRDVLGENVQWLIGSAALGFAAVPLGNEAAPASADLPRIVDVSTADLQLRVPSADAAPAPENCSYFAGIWNAPRRVSGAGAFHALSMDIYARMMESYGTAVPPGRPDLDYGSPKGRVLATALRRENDILSESIREHSAREAEALAARDAAWQERDAVIRERDLLLTQKDDILRNREAIQAERDAARAERDELLPAALRWRALVRRVNGISPAAARLAAKFLRWRLTPR